MCSAVLQRRPMISQCLTSAALFGASDVVAQQLVEKKGLKNHDVRRVLCSYRFAANAPGDCSSTALCGQPSTAVRDLDVSETAFIHGTRHSHVPLCCGLHTWTRRCRCDVRPAGREMVRTARPHAVLLSAESPGVPRTSQTVLTCQLRSKKALSSAVGVP